MAYYQVTNGTAARQSKIRAKTRESDFLAGLEFVDVESLRSLRARAAVAGSTGLPSNDAAVVGDPDADLLSALREGDENAFEALVADFHSALMRTAVMYVRDPAAAEDVVQETWIGLLESIDRFEGRCSIKTWLFRILFNKAQNRAAKDRRLVPFATLAAQESSSQWSSVDPASFHRDANSPLNGHWVEPPPAWKTSPEQILLDKEAMAAVKQAIGELPPAQGTVMLMRDVEGLSSKEVCNALQITATNQRVLLHRARTKVRQALAARFGQVK